MQIRVDISVTNDYYEKILKKVPSEFKDKKGKVLITQENLGDGPAYTRVSLTGPETYFTNLIESTDPELRYISRRVKAGFFTQV